MPHDPIVQSDLKEEAMAAQLGLLLRRGPPCRILNLIGKVLIGVPINCLDHYASSFSFAHMFNGPPESIWHFGVSKSQLMGFLFFEKDFSLFDLVIEIDLAICADARSTSSLWQMTVVLKSLPLSHIATFSDHVHFYPTDIVKYVSLTNFSFQRVILCCCLLLFCCFTLILNLFNLLM